MKYSDFNFKLDTDYNVAKIGNAEVKVLKYLPIKDKIDLIQIALQNSEQNGLYNEMKLDMYFNLYLIYMYTDLEFTDEEKANDAELYDELNCNHVILSIIGAMEEDEYDNLLDYLNETKMKQEEFKKSAAALLQSFIQDLPKNAQAAASIVDNFDKEKYQNVVDFVKSANNNQLP